MKTHLVKHDNLLWCARLTSELDLEDVFMLQAESWSGPRCTACTKHYLKRFYDKDFVIKINKNLFEIKAIMLIRLTPTGARD